MNYKTYTGVMLKHAPLREADEIIIFWSWEQGKVRFLVRGVKKSASRLKGVLTPLSWLTLQAVPSGNLPVVTGVQIVRKFSMAAKRLESLAAAFNFFESVLSTTPDLQPNQKISLLLKNSLEHLDASSGVTGDFLNSFRMRLIEALGYGLETKECVECTMPANRLKTCSISLLASGVLCDNCSVYYGDLRTTSAEVLEYLSKVGAAGEKEAVIESSDKGVQKQASSIISDYLFFLTEREMKSEKFLKENVIV